LFLYGFYKRDTHSSEIDKVIAKMLPADK